MERKLKVLVIEDNPVIVRMNEALLNNNGYEVISAGDGLKGIEMARSERPDVILLDIILPEMHGFEVCKELRKDARTKNIPVVIVTGSGLEDVAAQEPELAPEGCLAKPYNFEQIDGAIKQALAKARSR